MPDHRQVPLTLQQLYRLEVYRYRAFGFCWTRLENRIGLAAHGDTLEAIASGLTRALVCRKAGRMAGYPREIRRGLRPYNVTGFFAP